MSHWTLEDIPWERFDRTRVDPDILAVVKAAAMVERNSSDYAVYLCNVFAGDAQFQATAEAWGVEEIQHGEALGRWAERADPGFDFEASFRRFTDGYRIPVEATSSVRGSLSGEMVSRCIVETATSSLYSALRDATDEPVLKFISAKIAGDEFRHYKLFYTELQKCLARERPSTLRRIWVALGRIREADDDELGYAYYAANLSDRRYDRVQASTAYIGRICALQGPGHVRRASAMVMKAVGLPPQGRIGDLVYRLMWRHYRRQARKVQSPAPAAAIRAAA